MSFVCGLRGKSRQQFCACGRSSDFLCDWKILGKKSGTCDAPICKTHAKEVAPGKHLCSSHQVEYSFWKRRHPDVTIPQQPNLFEGNA